MSQIKTLKDLTPRIDTNQFERFGRWIAEQQGLKPEQIAEISPAQLEQVSSQFVRERGAELFLSLNANPVELAALITAFAATLFVLIFWVDGL